MTFAVVLALANACCFARCLVHSGESGAQSCHEHGKSNADHCVQQHDLKTTSASGVVSVAFATLDELAISPPITLEPAPEYSNLWLQPPGRFLALQPLRI